VGTWLDENLTEALASLAAAAAVALLVAIAFGVSWFVARRGRARETGMRARSDRNRLALELALAEQTARLRIIRELHEVAVHGLSVMIGQADGARYAAETDPGAAVRSAAVIADAGRATLADLRRVMTIVAEGEAEADTLPQLGTIRELLDVLGDAGLRISFVETGEPYDLGPGAELAIYGITQEALSNALKHGGVGTRVTVAFTWTGDGFQLRVDDDGVRNAARLAGRNPNDSTLHEQAAGGRELEALTGVLGGAGITEMRERTEIFGGSFTSTLDAGVGFSVAANFPSLRYHNGVHGVNLER
jgi:signal transduction histidine kinase